MKTKKLLRMLAVAIGLLSAGQLLALDHGSIVGNGTPLYPQRNGATPGTALDGKSFDFKIVTISNKTWAWTNLDGATVSADGWASQLRFWEPAKTEINLTGRADNSKQTFGTITRLPLLNPLTITFFQSWNNEFYETADFTYDYTAINSKDAADNEAPVLSEPTIVNQTALSLELALSATDNSGDYFYYIVDEANNFADVSFLSNITLALVAETAYNFSVYAIDFSGNTSDAATVVVQPQQATYITEGTAQAISFKLDSRSLTELVIECTSTSLIGDAFVKLEINGTAVDGEWKPTIAASGATTYQIIVPATAVPGWAEGGILGLNLGYIIMPIGDWGHYVVENKLITSGANTGAPILHKIGTGVNITDPEPEVECESNLLENSTMTLGAAYFAIGDSWTPSSNYTASWENNELNISLGDESWFQWQAQFPLMLETPLQMTAGMKYNISADIEINNDLPVYIKIMDNDDNAFIEFARSTVSATATSIKAYNLTCPEALTQITKILFDFGGNPANTTIKISNITICEVGQSEPLPVECKNNLLENEILTLGAAYFATGDGWTPSSNYTASWENNELNVSLNDETWFQWQAQFPLTFATPLQMVAGGKYGLTLDVETNNDVPVYAKFMDNDDNAFLEIARTTIAAPGKTISTYDLICPAALAQLSKIVFDFGGNPAGTNVKITNITLCDQMGSTTSLTQAKTHSISVYQASGNIVINSENQLAAVALYNINGQLLPVKLDGNTINISSLAKGIYMLRVEDSAANQQVFKIAIR